MAIGTSVGTVVAMTPFAVDMASSIGSSVPFFVAIVLGGAFFGDNLSFISDTTIAATRTQGCDMKDKFMANIMIVLPAAMISLVLYSIFSPHIDFVEVSNESSSYLVVPYLLVIILALIGINVAIVLLAGILVAVLAGLFIGMPILNISM